MTGAHMGTPTWEGGVMFVPLAVRMGVLPHILNIRLNIRSRCTTRVLLFTLNPRNWSRMETRFLLLG